MILITSVVDYPKRSKLKEMIRNYTGIEFIMFKISLLPITYKIDCVKRVLSFIIAVTAYSFVITVELLLTKIFSKTSSTSSSVTCKVQILDFVSINFQSVKQIRILKVKGKFGCLRHKTSNDILSKSLPAMVPLLQCYQTRISHHILLYTKNQLDTMAAVICRSAQTGKQLISVFYF